MQGTKFWAGWLGIAMIVIGLLTCAVGVANVVDYASQGDRSRLRMVASIGQTSGGLGLTVVSIVLRSRRAESALNIPIARCHPDPQTGDYEPPRAT